MVNLHAYSIYCIEIDETHKPFGGMCEDGMKCGASTAIRYGLYSDGVHRNVFFSFLANKLATYFFFSEQPPSITSNDFLTRNSIAILTNTSPHKTQHNYQSIAGRGVGGGVDDPLTVTTKGHLGESSCFHKRSVDMHF
jgi:hypothetical protein